MKQQQPILHCEIFQTQHPLAAALSFPAYSNMENIRIINIHNHCPLSTAQLWLSGWLTSSNVSSNSVDILINNIVITLLAHPTHDDPAKSLWLHNIPYPALLLCCLFRETVTCSPLWNAGMCTTSNVPTNMMVRLIIDTNNDTGADALVRYNRRVLNFK